LHAIAKEVLQKNPSLVLPFPTAFNNLSSAQLSNCASIVSARLRHFLLRTGVLLSIMRALNI